jgi:hypothetical protein
MSIRQNKLSFPHWLQSSNLRYFVINTVHILWIIKNIMYLAAVSKIGGLWLCSCIAVLLTISVPTSIQTEALHFKKSHSHIWRVLLQNGGFCNTCTMKRCLHRKMDFKTNALNNAHVSQLLHYKAGLLQNDRITLYFKIKTNSLQVDTNHRTLLVKVS